MTTVSLDAFQIVEGELHWATQEQWDAAIKSWSEIDYKTASRMKRKKIPFGDPCGWRRVVGRGSITTFSGRNVLSCDVIHALCNAGAWPWESGSWPEWIGASGDAALAKVATSTWGLEGGDLVWLASPHASKPARSTANGFSVEGREGDSVISRQGVGFLKSDAVHLIKYGHWPT